MTAPDELQLVVRRVIEADAARLFNAWTTPAQLQAWWGPRGVRCVHAEVDARVGGRYRIGNELPDGRVVWISGEFLVVEPPCKLVYTWAVDPGTIAPERVTVQFIAQGTQTEVEIVHERIADARKREEHAAGWEGCLDGLVNYVARPQRPD